MRVKGKLRSPQLDCLKQGSEVVVQGSWGEPVPPDPVPWLIVALASGGTTILMMLVLWLVFAYLGERRRKASELGAAKMKAEQEHE